MRNRRVKKQFLRLVSKGPYYKPTQVGELRMRRRTEEFALRNSAKYICNLGINMAIARWLQRNGPSDCLPKTQVYANQQWEVYGLTPARCWKVKRSCQTQVEAANLSPSKRRP